MGTKVSTAFIRFFLIACLHLSALPDAFGAVYAWDFDSGTLATTAGSAEGTMSPRGNTAPLAFFETTGTTYPNIQGQPAHYLRHNAWGTPAANDPTLGFALTFSATGPNGGGVYINQYSFVVDIYIPGSIEFIPLFQTDIEMTAGDDADFYIAPDGSLGNYALGYSVAGLVLPNRWYRIGFIADLAADDVRYYIDGARVHTSPAGDLLDGRFSLYSNAIPGPDLLLFNENDPSGNYTDAALYNSLAFFDYALSEAQMAALGTATAAGIFLPEPTVVLLLMTGLVWVRNGRRWVGR